MNEGPTVAEVLAATVAELGVQRAFGIPGGGTSALVVALEAHGIAFVLTHTETAAALMAATEAERTGVPGVVFTSSGPGAASVVDGVAHARLDRAPLLLVTDRQPEAANRDGYHQWLDQTGLFRSVVKLSLTLNEAHTATTLQHAVRTAAADPPGPVHLDVPAGLARRPATTTGPGAAPPGVAGSRTARRPRVDDAIVERVRAAARPVVLAGLGTRELTAGRLEAVASGLRAPVLTTYKGKGAIDETSPWAAGIVTGGAPERELLAAADLVVSVGLDPVELFPSMPPLPGRVALEPYATPPGALPAPTLEVVGELDHLLDALPKDGASTWEAEEVATGRRVLEERLAASPATGTGLHPWELAVTLSEAFSADADVTVDAGAHMLPVAQAWRTRRPGAFVISNGLATMGFGLPAATARSAADPERRVVCCTGDGGLLMVAGELATAARVAHRLTVVVFDDRSLSLIRVKQRGAELGRGVDIEGPDLAAVAAGFGLASHRVTEPAQLRPTLEATRGATRPTLVVVDTDHTPYAGIIELLRG